MRKFFAVVLGMGLLCVMSASPADVEAQSRPSSSGSRPSVGSSKPSFSSGSRPSVGSSRPSVGSSRPSVGSSKPHFSSGQSKPSNSKPSFTAPKPSQPSQPKFTGGQPKPPPSSNDGSKPKFSSGNSTNKPPPSDSSKPKFSGGMRPSDPKSVTGSKPSSPKYDAKAAEAQKKVESRQAMIKAEAPKPSFRVNGKEVKIDRSASSVTYLRTTYTHDMWVTRDTRIHTFYAPVYYSRPVVVYSDPYSSLFWYYLLDQSLERQAMWAYCHRNDMDQARYNALLAKNAALAARVNELERNKVARDSNYVLPGMDPDLQYSDEYVDAVVNPQAAPSYLGWILLWVFIGVIVVILLIYLIFVKEWQ